MTLQKELDRITNNKTFIKLPHLSMGFFIVQRYLFGMRLLISESEKKSILKLYGLVNEQLTSGQKDKISCNNSGCRGTYSGPEDVNGNDTAHDFSNDMSDKVGIKLKELFNGGKYSKVDMDNIVMSTSGKGTGNVKYYLEIPFILVSNKCDAYTSFDHVGGWNHSPELNARKNKLQSLLIPGDVLNVSKLKKTPEGLQEYWIQWRNKELQSDCENSKKITNSDGEKFKKNIEQNKSTTQIPLITGPDYEKFRTNIKEKTKKLSIDWDSTKLDLPNRTLKVYPGDDKLVNLSLIWSNVSEDDLTTRFDKIKDDNEEDGYTVKSKNSIYQDGYWFLLIAILY